MKLRRRVISILMVVAMMFSTSAEAFAEGGGLRLADDLIPVIDTEDESGDEITVIDPEAVSDAQSEQQMNRQLGLSWRTIDLFPVLREEQDETAQRFWALLLGREPETLKKENEDGTLNVIPVPSLTVQGWLPGNVRAEAVFSAYDEQMNTETALMNVEIKLTDNRGEAWRPRYPLIVSVSGEAVEAARLAEKSFIVYSYAEEEHSSDIIPIYTYTVRVFRDFNPYVDDPTVPALEEQRETVSTSYARFSKDARYPSAVSFKMETSELSFALTAKDAPRSVNAESGEAAVSVSGTLPEEVTAQIEPVDTAVITASLDEEPVLAWDISLKTGGENYQPAEKVTVTLTDPAIAEALAAGKTLQLWHLRHDADPELVESAVFEGDTVRFVTDGFSVYVIVEHEGGQIITPRVEFHYIDSDFTDNGNGTYTAGAYHFVNKHNELQISQILKDGESLEMIANPANKTDDQGNETSFFYGWYAVDLTDDSTVRNADTGKWTGTITYSWLEDKKVDDEIRATVAVTADNDGDGKDSPGDTVTWTIGTASGTAVLDEKGTAHVYLAPAFADFYFVNYHMGNKEAHDGLKNNLLTRRLVIFGTTDTATVRIGDIMCPSPDPQHQIFSGWETVKTENNQLVTDVFFKTMDPNGNEITETRTLAGELKTSAGDGYHVIITKDNSTVKTLDLYPVFAEARWLHYDTGTSGNGAQYVGSAYRLTNDDGRGTSFDVLSTSSRSGYDFDGWYVNAAMVNSVIMNASAAYDVTATVKVNGVDTQVTTHYSSAIRLTDETGAFVTDVKGKVFYQPLNTPADTDTEKYSWIESAASLPTGAKKLFEVTSDGKLYLYKDLDSLQVGAKWNPKNVKYTVVYWLENANDNDYTLMYYKTLQGSAGAQTAATECTTADTFVENGVTDSYYNKYKLQFAHLAADQDKGKAGEQSGIKQQSIAGDGSTIVNVYYDRNRYTLRFDIGYSFWSSGKTTYYVSGITNSLNYNEFLTSSRVSCGTTIPADFASCGTYTQKSSGTTYTIYYYDLTAKYGEHIADRWPDTQPDRPNNYGFIGWICLENSYYYQEINTSSIKGDYECMDEGVILVGSGNNYTATTAENGIAHEFRCRYQQNTNKYVYRVFFWDPEQSDFPATPNLEMKVNSAGAPKYRAVAAYSGYTETDVVVKLVKGNENGNEVDLPSNSNESYSAYYVSSVGYNAMIINYYYRPNLHRISYKYGSGSPDVGTSFSVASRSYYYNQSVADANVNEEAAVAATPEGYRFDGWYENQDGVGSKFNFNTVMPDGDIVLYAVYKPLKYRVTVNPDGAEIDHIDHTGAAYTGTYNGVSYSHEPFNRAATNERSADSGYKDNQATYINGTYGEKIIEYAVSRKYVPISDTAAEIYKEQNGRVYCYVNMQYQNTDGSGLPSDLRNALYIDITENENELRAYYDFWHWYVQTNWDLMPDAFEGMTAQNLSYEAWKNLYVTKKENSNETQLYRLCNSQENWVFLGWFRDGESMPYDFNEPVREPFSLTAKWRLDGGYKVQYIPEYSMPNGDLVNGRMQDWIDPVPDASTQMSYTDGARTTVYKQPTNLTLNGHEVSDNSLVFRGWRLVSVTSGQDALGNTVYTYTPLENNVYYDPGDEFFIDVQYADSNSLIHMQAVYEPISSSYRRPEIANLTLDANGGFLTMDGETELSENKNLSWNEAGTILMDKDTERIAFGDIQSNEAVRLYQYASVLTQNSAGETLDPAGKNYFKHPDGHFLLGFDKAPNEEDYIASYPSDSIITVQRTDEETIYAVWEPMVYLTLVNHADGDIHFSINASTAADSEALEIINLREDIYERKPVSSYADVLLAKGQEMRLAFPKGAEKSITISGTNTLGVGKALVWNSSLNLDGETGATAYDTAAAGADVSYSHTVGSDTHSHLLVTGEAKNTEAFSIQEGLIVNSQPLTVTFTTKYYAYAMVLKDNWSGGGIQEFDYSAEEIQTASSPKTQELPRTSSRPMYEFLGWAYSSSATEPDFSATKPDGTPWTVTDLQAFFSTDTYEIGSGADKTTARDLYAVWKYEEQAKHVYIYKDVPEPGDQEKLFTFTVDISGTFTYDSEGHKEQISATGTFQLAHGEHADLYSTNITADGFIQTVVTLYDADGNVKKDSENNPLTVTVRAQAQHPAVENYGSFNGTEHFSVTETAETYYTTTVTRNSQVDNTIPIRIWDAANNSDFDDTTTNPWPDVQSNKINWYNTDAGGTVMFTNTRSTKDIAVEKTLISNGSTTFNFNFSASYTVDGKTRQLNDFIVTSGTPNTSALKEIPEGAVLTVTEAENDNYQTSVQVGSATATDGKTTSFTVTDDDTVSFTNELISYPVRIVKVDQTEYEKANPQGGTVEAFFSLAAGSYGIGTNLYANSTNNGVFYQTDASHPPLYAGETYTLTETWVQEGYQGLDNPVTITVSGKTGHEFTFSDPEHVKAVFDSVNGVWNIYVKNQEVKTITVVKELKDPLVSSRAFHFSYSYVFSGETISDSFDLSPSSTTSAKKELVIPVNATGFVVTEDRSPLANGAYTIAQTYDTTISYQSASTNVTPSAPLSATEAASYTVASVTEDATITFKNERKTVDITISKTVIGNDTSGSFAFEVRVLNGNLGVNNYQAAAGLTTDADGAISFSLTNSGQLVVKLPVGANIKVTENLTEEQQKLFTAFMTMPGVDLELVNGKAESVELTSPTEDKEIRVFNIPAICKVTDQNGNLLYVLQEGGNTPDDDSDDIYIPAIFSTIKGAFMGRDGVGGLGNYYPKGSTVKYSATAQHQIQMLVDYQVPNSDVVTVNPGYNMVFTTAATNAADGYPFRRSGEYEGTLPQSVSASLSVGKAVLTREDGSTEAFFTVGSESATQTTTFAVSKLILDGDGDSANMGENVKGGCLTAYKSTVTIENCVIYNFKAEQGGAVYTTGDSLTVTGSIFDTCISEKAGNGFGGGAIHTIATTVNIGKAKENASAPADTQFLNCSSVHQGGAVYHHGKNKTMTMNNCRFEDCTSRSGGALEADVTTVNVTDCTFQSCTAKKKDNSGGNAGGLNSYFGTTGIDTRPEDSHLTVTRCSFLACTAEANGGGMQSLAVTTELIDCTFTGCTAANGGGVSLSGTAQAELKGTSRLERCSATNGGGVYVNESAKLTMSESAVIQNCKSSNNGGAIFVTGSNAKADINGGTIRDNTANGFGGGAIRVEGGATVTISGDAQITGNKLTSDKEKCGGAIGIKNGTVSISGGSISGNYAQGSGGGTDKAVQGGAVFVEVNGVLNISGGTISGNYVNATNNGGYAYGGAICAKSGGVINLSGGTISGNYATGKNAANVRGAGIYLAEGARLNISGSPSFGGADTDEDGSFGATDGNRLQTTITATNGGKSYTSARQDIFVAGYSGTTAQSIHVTGNIASGRGAIWVWAEAGNGTHSDGDHIHRADQFAILDAPTSVTISEASLSAFRDARADTDSLATGSPLYGVKSSKTGEETYVVWGNVGGLDVTFIKRDGFGEALSGAKFAVYSDLACQNAVSVTLENGKTEIVSETTTGRVSFRVPLGIYYMKETYAPAGYEANENVYIILVGDANLTVPTNKTGTLWAAGEVMEGINQAQIDAQKQQNASSFAIFLVKDGKAASMPDIAKYGIINVSSEKRPAILTKIDENLRPLADVEFRILKYDRSEFIPEGAANAVLKSDQYGIYYYGQLPLGTYLVEEMTDVTGSGYKQPTHYFVFKVTEKGIMSETMLINGDETTNTIFESQNDTAYTIPTL